MTPRTLNPVRARDAHESVAGVAEPLQGTRADYDRLLDDVAGARFVLIGEASHGTHEFYVERAELTRRLVEEHGFGGVCIEGDWPDAQRVNDFVTGAGNDSGPEDALAGFTRFPAWMWRNTVMRDFVSWLREYNMRRPAVSRCGVFGLDLYSMFTSMRSVLDYLDAVDPDAARRARQRYACFDHFDENSQTYGYAVAAEMAEPCEEEAVRQLVDIRMHEPHYMSQDGRPARDRFFSAEQNARLVANAENYYRAMYRGRVSSWNLRDRHMADTLDAVASHLAATGRMARLVVWAHNSHLGDARYTALRRRGELNLGQLARERHGDAARIIGFSTHHGTVTAAHDWDEPARQYRVRPSLPDSCERLLHDTARELGADRFLVRLREHGALPALSVPRLQRAIGVIYRPETERLSHYYEVELARQFDAIIHIDTTSALRALEPGAEWREGAEPPETYPSGM
jgi:erythromycin esterase-like protein